MEEEYRTREYEISSVVDRVRLLKAESYTAANEAKKAAEAFRDEYDILVAEDKVMEKSFKRELAAELPASLVDQLNKLYRRRPKGKGIGLGAGSPVFTPDGAALRDAGDGGVVASLDPYYPRRPTTAMKTRKNVELLEEALKELDSEDHMPENCPPDVWERMCQIRRTKIDSEQVLKGKGKGRIVTR